MSKVGVAVGDRAVHFVWPDLELEPDALASLATLAAEVTFLGTSRSPAIVTIATEAPATNAAEAWEPATHGGRESAEIRVPDPPSIARFDARHDARRSRRQRVEPAGHIPEISIGRRVGYSSPRTGTRGGSLTDPAWWGDFIVLALDRECSEIQPKTAAAYAFARAVRVALLGAYGPPGSDDEAPPVLRARGAEPHCAVVPLFDVRHQYADGRILGVAFLLPHERRAPAIAEQRPIIERGLARLVRDEPGAPRRFVQVPRAGKIWLGYPDAQQARSVTLRLGVPSGSASVWVSITPIVHSRWRKGGPRALLDQVAMDCAHVGLPAPDAVETLRGPGRPGGPTRTVPPKCLPEAWRDLLNGPSGHLRITFPEPVRGPVLLGKARHFGLGLCVPVEMAPTDLSVAP